MQKLFSILVFFCLPALIHSTEWKVCPDCEISTIKEGINKADSGDVVLVFNGIYKEGNIVVDKSIHLKGVDNPVIDGENNTEIITVVADQVTLSGLTVQNVGVSYLEDRAGIRIQKSKNFIIRDNFLLNTFFGIYLEHSNDGLIENNQVLGKAVEEMSSGNAIHMWYCKRIKVVANKVERHRDGIYLEFVDDSEISKNLSTQNLRYGLHFMFSNYDDYFDNVFSHNGAGVAVMFSKKINMWKNHFYKNWGKSSYGLLLKEIYDGEIYQNVFEENTQAIYVEGSTRINYFQNDFIRNGWAIKIAGGCMDNVITKNNFVSNTFDLAINKGMHNNKFNNNYWSEYRGYDLDKDGIGDVPFRPVKLFNYVVNRTPEAMVLLRSLFVDLINFSEKVSPVLTPDNVKDEEPSIRPFPHSKE